MACLMTQAERNREKRKYIKEKREKKDLTLINTFLVPNDGVLKHNFL